MSTEIHGQYFGKGNALLGVYLKTAVLTVITLGIYRFWGKTRIRRYIWSATSGGDDSFEYTGTGLEKFLGFLIAIVILAIYLGLVQMVLFFFGIALFSEPETATEALVQIAGIYITIFATIPLLLFARYRARRYKMARTRWRGLRFGMEKGAWGFVWRAIGHYFLTIITLGILLPRQTFYLEKFMADRSWYGDGKFEQTGRWTELYPGMKHMFIGVAILVAGVAIGVSIQSAGLAGLASSIGYIWFLVGVVSYRVFSMNYLTSHKILDGAVSFGADLQTGKIVKIYVVGGLTMLVVMLVLGIAFASVVMGIMLGQADGFDPEAFAAGANLASVVLSVLSYVFFFLVIGAIALVMIVQNVIAHTVTNIHASPADHLETLRQRAADTGADAEGFADALDVGGAI